MSSHLIDTSEEEDCVVALALYVSDLLDEGKVSIKLCCFISLLNSSLPCSYYPD